MRLSALTTLRSSRRGARIMLASAAVAVATSLALPAAAHAAPATPKLDERTLDSMAAFAPAIIGSVATPGPDGKVNAELLAQAETLAKTPGLPPQIADLWQSVADFLGEPGRQDLIASQKAEKKDAAKQEATKREADEERKPGDPEIPQGPNAPKIQEFLYPTIGVGCMGGTDFNASLGRALVTAGPQEAPAPGPKRGEAGYVYTALGTGPAVDNPGRKLWVSWLNIDTGRTGQTQLKRNPRINSEDGPGTFTAIARTGKGRVVSTIYGDVTTKNKEDKSRSQSCTIAPTIGLAII